MSEDRRNHSHYFKNVAHLKQVDVYRVLQLFGVTDPCLQHAIKKLLVAGGRGAGKSSEKDVREASDSLSRWLQMKAEDCNYVPEHPVPLPALHDAGAAATAQGVDLVTQQLASEGMKVIGRNIVSGVHNGR